MLKKVKTQMLIRELETEGHAPMLFLCDDGSNYYVKYLLRVNEQRFLLYELIGSVLCEHQGIPTPEYGLVEIAEHSYDRKELKANKRLLRPGVTGFGSKEVKESDLFTEFYIPGSKKDFNQFVNPLDLIKIALLDLWILNTDRKEGRYNFIFANREEGKRILAIDHAFSFGGVKQRHFAAHDLTETGETLMNTKLLNTFVRYIGKRGIAKCIDDFFYLCNDESRKKIETLFARVPENWGIEDAQKARIIEFLFNTERLNRLKFISQQLLLKTP